MRQTICTARNEKTIGHNENRNSIQKHQQQKLLHLVSTRPHLSTQFGYKAHLHFEWGFETVQIYSNVFKSNVGMATSSCDRLTKPTLQTAPFELNQIQVSTHKPTVSSFITFRFDPFSQTGEKHSTLLSRPIMCTTGVRELMVGE